MLGRIALIVLQTVIAWIGAHTLVDYVALDERFSLFLFAALFAVLVYVTGVVGSKFLRGTALPATAALTSSFAVALVVAMVLTFASDAIPPLPDWFNSHKAWVLAGAIFGYVIRG